MAARNLTGKQRRFIENYMGKAAGNATEAARLAGYQGDDNTLATVAAPESKLIQYRLCEAPAHERYLQTVEVALKLSVS